jgi:hypothetical protein
VVGSGQRFDGDGKKMSKIKRIETNHSAMERIEGGGREVEGIH